MGRWGPIAGWLRRARSRGADEDRRYRSPAEVALHNAADSLGVALGEYYPDDAELPQELSEWGKQHPDADRLAASREEMLTYIDRLRSSRRSTRRRRAIWAAVPAVVVAGGIVVTLGRDHAPEGDQAQHRASARVVQIASWRKLSPVAATGRGIPSMTGDVAVTLPTGGSKIIASAFVDLRGDVCGKVAHVVNGVTKTYGVGGCTPPARIRWMLAAEPAALLGIEMGRGYILLTGYARPSVRDLSVRRPNSRGEIAVSGPWMPDRRAGKSPIKLVLIKVPWKAGLDARGGLDARTADAGMDAVMEQQHFEFAAKLDDGSVARVRGWWHDRPMTRNRLVNPIASPREG